MSWRRYLAPPVLLLTSCMPGAGPTDVSSQPDPCCRPKLSNASCWGFSGVDDTAALQSMLKCTTERLVVPNYGVPWVTAPLWVVPKEGLDRSAGHPRRVELEEGTTLEALRGNSSYQGRSYQDLNTALLVIADVDGFALVGLGKGATIRMHKDEYVNSSLFRHAEWRMGIWVAGTAGLLLERLTISMSGGDGVYLSHAPPCDKPPHCVYTPAAPERIPREIALRSVSSLFNLRQGLSIIAVDGFVAEDCDFSMTGRWPPSLLDRAPGLGAPHTAPAAGVSTALPCHVPLRRHVVSNGAACCVRSISSLTIQRT